ncbi:probable cytochrome P450 6a13 [Musca domestica]|nr:probable cytochrome P450 6a13 [Musca domestica]
MIFLSLLLLATLALWLWVREHYSYWEKRNVPHEKPLPFIGNMRGLGRQYHWKDINERIYKKFKNTTPIAGFYTFTTRAAFVMDLDVVKDIMIKQFQSFTDRGLFHNERDDPLTANLLFLDGERWRVLRHKVSPVFTTGKMKFMFPTVVQVGERLEPACLKFINSEDGSGIVEAKDLCARYTTDVIGTCAFGIECNSLIDPQAEFRKMGRSIFEKPRHNGVIQGLMFTQPKLAQKLRMKTFSDDVAEFFMTAVKETVEYRQKNKIRRNDFMDMLIEMKEERDRLLSEGQSVDEGDVSGGLTLEQLAAQAMVFFLAGFDTSSTTISFCLYELALNQEVQDKVRQEILEVLGNNNNQLTYESLKDMKYLDMVISETLRKYSVTPHLVRMCVKDYQVPNTDIVLEKGLRVIIPLDSIHRDGDYFPEPEKFNPDRFRPEEVAKRHPFSFLPFGDGPRNCIGMRFGKMQAQIGLICLLQKFRFDRCPQTQIPMRYSKLSFLLGSEGGVYLKVEKLEEKNK